MAATVRQLLIGPLVAGRLSTLPDFDYHECARAAVDGFLHVQRMHSKVDTTARSGLAGALNPPTNTVEASPGSTYSSSP
jgi:hypothetical protein